MAKQRDEIAMPPSAIASVIGYAIQQPEASTSVRSSSAPQRKHDKRSAMRSVCSKSIDGAAGLSRLVPTPKDHRGFDEERIEQLATSRPSSCVLWRYFGTDAADHRANARRNQPDDTGDRDRRPEPNSC